MRIFVTGANGFIGRAFCRVAALNGHEVLGLCRAPEASLPGGVKVLRGALDSIPWVQVKDFEPDALLHLAWSLRPGSLNSPDNVALVNLSRQLFEEALKVGVRHLAASGTCIEYAPSEDPLSEDHSRLEPALAYSVAKNATREIMQKLAVDAGALWTWFRIFYAYGEGEHQDRLSVSIVRKLASDQAVELRTPDSVNDYLYVDDVASAMLCAIEKSLEGPVNVGSGTGIKIIDFARQAARVLNVSPDLIQKASPATHDPFPTTVADIAKLRGIGWTPGATLEEGLRKLISSVLHG